ncbi:cystathionine beta-lyase, chloroplastic [Quillaja saponaria]|uniref:Cystathionine beta-lyase, chloroplastic n=1 Tax=Quillaja saponaria TaxID=32244 RepID=A0AAD7Q838_QUISA|nr:cystathionine beta-lyase, chloroplastic [Quillaja saponaria]
MLLNFENNFDPYGAMSTPLYQTATFKQPSAIENGPYDYTKKWKSYSGCPGKVFRLLMLSYLAKLDKADRALCFTSGMAALAAVLILLEQVRKLLLEMTCMVVLTGYCHKYSPRLELW